MADAAPRVGVGQLDEVLDGALAVADDVGGHPLGDGGEPAVDDQAAVVAPGDVGLDDHPAAPGLVLGDRERRADVVGVLEVQADAAAVVAVERLDHDRVADAVGDGGRLVGGAHGLLLGHRQPGRAEQPGGEVLVGGDVDGDRAGGRGHRRPDPLLVDALAELDQRVLVEPDPGDVARDRLVEDRLGRRPERRALGTQDERLQLRVPVELRVGLDEVVDQAYGEPGGGEADLLVDVPVDDVVAPLLALDLPGLAAADVVADDLLQGEGDVLGDVAEPGALVEPLDEPAAAPAGAGVLAQPGQHLEQVVGEARQRVGREVLERAEVDDEVDRLVVGPHVGAAVDPGLEDRQVGGRAMLVMRDLLRSVLAGAAASQHGGGDVARGDVTSQPFQVASRNRELLGLARVDHGGLADQRLVGQVEHRAGGQHVQHDARGQQRRRTTGLVGVGDDVAAVEDGDDAAADDAQHLDAVDRR